MKNNELCVPASAVNEYEDDSDQAVNPGPGDTVEVTISGKVSRVEGGNVYLTPETANGEPIDAMSMSKHSDGDEEQDMNRMMEEQTAGGGY